MRTVENRPVIFLLILLAILSSWGGYLMQRQVNKNKNYGDYPDGIAFDIKLIDFDQTGFLNRIIYSKQAMHYPESKKTNFTDVHIEVLSKQNIPSWFITAPSATMDDKGDVIVAHDLVTMQQAAYPDHFATTLTTRDVTLLTDKKYLSTEAPVQLVQTGLQIDAVGMLYDYDHQVLHLLHQIHTVYQPNLRGK